MNSRQFTFYTRSVRTSLRMKFLLLSIFVFTVNGAPQISSEFVTEDQVARKIIKDELRVIEKLSNDNEVAKSIVKSIDQDCMLEAYRKNKLLNELTEEALDISSISGDTKIDPILVFANIALSCSNKLDKLLGFLFDNIFSYSGLLDAFRDDEFFKKHIDDLVCFNNYAVKTNVLDPSAYSLLKYELVNRTQEECDKEVMEMKELATSSLESASSFVVSDHSKCLQNELAISAEKFFLRYVLLIPLGLSEDQKKAEKMNFIEDSREGLEKILTCNAGKASTTDNEISVE
jgi:hypothetical protein